MVHLLPHPHIFTFALSRSIEYFNTSVSSMHLKVSTMQLLKNIKISMCSLSVRSSWKKFHCKTRNLNSIDAKSALPLHQIIYFKENATWVPAPNTVSLKKKRRYQKALFLGSLLYPQPITAYPISTFLSLSLEYIPYVYLLDLIGSWNFYRFASNWIIYTYCNVIVKAWN